MYRPACIVVMLLLTASTAAQQETREQPERKQDAIVFTDRFDADSRGKYLIRGSAEWKPGQIRIREAAVLGKHVNAGVMLRATMDLEWPKLQGGQRSQAAAVAFMLGDGKTIRVLLDRKREDERVVGSITILQKPGAEPDAEAQTIRRFTDLPDFRAGSWTIEYRSGLVSVRFGSELEVFGYVPGWSRVNSLAIVAGEGEIACTALNLVANVHQHFDDHDRFVGRAGADGAGQFAGTAGHVRSYRGVFRH